MRRPVALLVVLAAIAPAAAHAAPSVLSRTEICDPDGGYASIGDVVSLAGGNEELVVVATPDGGMEIRRFNSGGQPLGRLQLPPEMADFSYDTRLDRGPPGRVYATDGERVLDLVVGQGAATVRREIFGAMGAPLRNPLNLVASTNGQSHLLDADGIHAYDTESGQLQYTGDTTITNDPHASRTVAVTATKGILTLAKTHDDGTNDKLAFFYSDKAGNRIDYRYSVDTPPDIDDASGGASATWVSSNVNGLSLIGSQGEVLASLPELNGAYHVDQPADGTAWVSRSDGLYHIGDGGTKVEPSVYRGGYKTCGPARLKLSFPASQDIDATGKLVTRVRPSELVNVRVTGTLAAGKIYQLKGTTKRVEGGTRANLPLRFSRSALGALRRTVAAGGTARIVLHFVATDASGQITRSDKLLELGHRR